MTTALTIPSHQLVCKIFHDVGGRDGTPFQRSQPLSLLGLDQLQRLEFIAAIAAICRLDELPDLKTDDPTPDALFDALIHASLNNKTTEWRTS